MLIAVFAVAAAAIVAVLLIPIDLGITAPAVTQIQVRVRWLFGLVSVNLPGSKPRPKQSSREPKKPGHRTLSFRRIKRAFLTNGLLTAFAKFLRRLMGAVKIREIRLHVRLGFDDPADTGMLLAAAAPVLWLLRRWTEDRFFLEPDFDQEIAHADGKVDVRIYPIRIIGASVMFLLSPATLRAAFQLL